MTKSYADIPASLRQRMNSDGEISTFRKWFGNYSEKRISASLSTRMIYDKESCRFVHTLDNPYGCHSCLKWFQLVVTTLTCSCSALQHAIEKYAAQNPDDNFWKKCDPKSCCWNNVIEELEDAHRVYQEKGDRNFARRTFRQGSGVARNLIPMLESIPQDDGLGVLKGGFLVIFNVCDLSGRAKKKGAHDDDQCS